MPPEDWQSRSRSPLAWAITFSVIGLLITIGFAAIVIPRIARRAHRGSMTYGAVKVEPLTRPLALAEAYPVANGRPPRPVARAGETILNESNADQIASTGNETTLTKTFALDDGAAFALESTNGSMTISAWDQSKAEVKVIKSGSGPGSEVFFTSSSRDLSIRTAPSGAHWDLRYEIKLPRKIGRVELNSVNGPIKLSGVTGQIFIDSANGGVELNDVARVSRVRTANGKITATLQAASEGPMEFVTANAGIDVTIKSGFNAHLDASTVHGIMNIDDQLGIPVQKEMVGQHARGQIGLGGQPLKLTAVNGSVKLSRQ